MCCVGETVDIVVVTIISSHHRRRPRHCRHSASLVFWKRIQTQNTKPAKLLRKEERHCFVLFSFTKKIWILVKQVQKRKPLWDHHYYYVPWSQASIVSSLLLEILCYYHYYVFCVFRCFTNLFSCFSAENIKGKIRGWEWLKKVMHFRRRGGKNGAHWSSIHTRWWDKMHMCIHITCIDKFFLLKKKKLKRNRILMKQVSKDREKTNTATLLALCWSCRYYSLNLYCYCWTTFTWVVGRLNWQTFYVLFMPREALSWIIACLQEYHVTLWS